MAKVVVVKKKKEVLIKPEPSIEPVVFPTVVEIPEPEPAKVEIEEEHYEEEDVPEPEPIVHHREEKPCSWSEWRSYVKGCLSCPYFPVCCNLPLVTSFQVLLIFDLIIAAAVISMWISFHQSDPLRARIRYNQSGPADPNESLDDELNQDSQREPSGKAPTLQEEEKQDYSIFSEATTEAGHKQFIWSGDAEGDALQYTKIVYTNLQYQQAVIDGCGDKYYVDHLFGYNLERTTEHLNALVLANFMSELLEIFIDLSFIVATCCFFSFTSARGYIIIMWMSELIPMSVKIWITIGSYSKSLCVFEYGLGIRVLTLLYYCHTLPLILFRVYKVIVFSYFIKSLFTKSGHLVHWTKIQGMTMAEYKDRERQYRKMGRDNDESSGSDYE